MTSMSYRRRWVFGPYWWQPRYAFTDNVDDIAEVHAFKSVTRLRVVAMRSLLSHPSALSYSLNKLRKSAQLCKRNTRNAFQRHACIRNTSYIGLGLPHKYCGFFCFAYFFVKRRRSTDDAYVLSEEHHVDGIFLLAAFCMLRGIVFWMVPNALLCSRSAEGRIRLQSGSIGYIDYNGSTGASNPDTRRRAAILCAQCRRV